MTLLTDMLALGIKTEIARTCHNMATNKKHLARRWYKLHSLLQLAEQCDIGEYKRTAQNELDRIENLIPMTSIKESYPDLL